MTTTRRNEAAAREAVRLTNSKQNPPIAAFKYNRFSILGEHREDSRRKINMMTGQTPILVLREGTKREKGRGALANNIAAAKAIADSVRSTLGPRGLDKMLVDSMGDVVVTNDGVTILKEMDVEHPAAKMLVEVAKTQDQEAGDGTTTAVILAGELLKRAEELIEQNIHPTIIAQGYRLASAKALEFLQKESHAVTIGDIDTLKRIAVTSMASKSVSFNREMMGDIAVKAVTAVAEKKGAGYYVDLDNIQLIKKQGGSMADTSLIEGVIIDKEKVHSGMPSRVENPKIALLDAALEIKKTEIDAKIEINDPAQLNAFLGEEENMLRRMVDQVKKSGANVVICQKGIDDLAQHFLAKQGVYAVRRAKKSDMEKLAKATGANIVSKVSELTPEDVGSAGLVEERKIGDDALTFVTGCKKAKAVSVLIRGGTEHVIDEIERSLDDALNVVATAVEDGRFVLGGGATAEELAMHLRDEAAKVGGREQISFESFAEALETIPRTLAENAGLDPIDILIELRQAHKAGQKNAGVNVLAGKVDDMLNLHVLEPIRVGRQAIQSAADAAVMILRIDDVIASKSSPPSGGPGGPGGPGGMGGGGMGGDFGED
jgi:thermosome